MFEQSAADMIVLGIDPGSRITGYGIVAFTGQKARCLDAGCIRVPATELDQKLQCIFSEITRLCECYRPTAGAIEQVFMHRNAAAALKLGQARGAAIAALSRHMPRVWEYSAKQIKQSVVGYGNAGKEQVQYMVTRLLNLSEQPSADAADALAAALCHAVSPEGRLACRQERKNLREAYA